MTNLQTGLFQFIYFTFLHNSQVIAYVILALISLIALLKKPSRRHVFFFIGFLVLTILFEYQKHIVQDLAEQTVDTIFITEGNYKAQWLVKTSLYHLLPLAMWVAGWGSLALGIILPGESIAGNKKKKIKEEKSDLSIKTDS